MTLYPPQIEGALLPMQIEVTLYLVSSAALGGYLASAALASLSGADIFQWGQD